MNSIFDQENEEYLRKFIEADEKLETNPKEALEKVLSKTQDIRELPGNKSVSPTILPSKGIFSLLRVIIWLKTAGDSTAPFTP